MFDSSTACKHLVEADLAGSHPFWIELNLKLAEIPSESLDRRHTRHREQSVLDLELGQVPELHQVGRTLVSFERELKDLVEATGETRNQRRIGAGRQLSRSLRHALGDELSRSVVVGIGFELDRDLRNTQLRVGANPPNIWQACQLHFQRDGNGGFQFLGTHRGVLRDDVEYRSREIREDIAPQVL